MPPDIVGREDDLQDKISVNLFNINKGFVKHADVHRTELTSRQFITSALAQSMFRCTESENKSTEYFEAGVQRSEAAPDSYSSGATKRSIRSPLDYR